MSYDEKQAEEVGMQLIKLLCLRRDPNFKGRYQTSWGNKTPTGIFNTIRRLGQMIENNEKITASSSIFVPDPEGTP